LAEIDDVVSTQSFELLVQCLYLGRVIFSELKPEETITATIEFVRFANMCGATGMEHLMAERIKAIIIANPAPRIGYSRDPDTNAYYLISQHIKSAASLPGGHPVRNILAMAAVEGYLIHDEYKFLRETVEIPSFSIDLLKLVKTTLKTVKPSGMRNQGVTCKNPISGETVWLGGQRNWTALRLRSSLAYKR
jgi:hypothetical protein